MAKVSLKIDLTGDSAVKPIDWHYHRKACTTCKTAQGFLTTHGCSVGESVDATKVKKNRDEALALARQLTRLVAARGKKMVTLDIASADDETILGHLMGPTGNLRAPTIRVGDTLVVGFNEEAYRLVLE